MKTIELATVSEAERSRAASAQEDPRDLLSVLKAELEFVERGGYRHPAHSEWRPQFMFEDSSSCLNYSRKDNPVACNRCVLMQLVPEDCQNRKYPCRHIPLNAEGYTLDTYYRLGTQAEAEVALAAWLRTAISQLEAQQPAVSQANTQPNAAGSPGAMHHAAGR